MEYDDDGASTDVAAGKGERFESVPASDASVSGTREKVAEGEQRRARLSSMRELAEWDRERLGYRFVKRAFDIVFSACVIAVAIVPSAVLCAAIAIESPGCPLYTQKRVGKGGKTIRILKLRSMVADAGDVQKYLSPEQLHQWEVERKVDDDPRITKVGQFIRKCSIDEMPQFINVLNGDLSVIGPRPITRDELEQHFTDEEKAELLSVQPGITGLWQATDRNEATFESGSRQKIELHYVRNRCFRMDLKCFTGTFGAMFGKRKTGR